MLSILAFPNPRRVAVSGAAPGQAAALTGTYFVQLGGGFGIVSGTLVYTDNQRGS